MRLRWRWTHLLLSFRANAGVVLAGLACFAVLGALLTSILLAVVAPGGPVATGLVAGAALGVATGLSRLSAPRISWTSEGSPPPFGALEPVTSERLGLRPVRAGDEVAIGRTVDDEVERNMGWSRRSARLWVQITSHPVLAAHHGMLVITDRADDRVVGMAGLSKTPDPLVAELGMWLGPAERGRGYGSEALALVVRVAGAAGLRAVELGTDVANAAMRRAAEHAGGVVVRRGDHTLPDGRTVDSVSYRLPTGTGPADPPRHRRRLPAGPDRRRARATRRGPDRPDHDRPDRRRP
jgi:RimJ/RimL family protein N-acetyltransferase